LTASSSIKKTQLQPLIPDGTYADAVHARGLHRDRNFLIYLFGNAVSWLGTWAQRIGIGWLSWDLTHRTAWVGIISLAQLLPLIFFGPLFGTLLDRHDHRRYALGVNLVLSALAGALYALTALHVMNIRLLFAMAILLGISNSAYQAVRLAIVNDVVSPEKRPAAIAINSLLFNVTRAVGPAIAGVIIAKFGIESAFAANAVSFIGILAALLAVKLTPRTTPATRRGLAAESLDGLRYVFHRPDLRQLILLSGVTSIFGRGVVELFPAYAGAVFQRGIEGLASFTTAAGIGAITGAVVLSRAHAGRPLMWTTRFATAALGIVVCLFGFCRSFLFAVPIAGLTGFMVVLCSVGLQVRLQTDVEDDYRGRVLGLWIAVNVAGPGLGGALLGAAAQLLGLQSVTIVSGLLCLALVSWITLLSG
jgi:predicted MFS family arabinose efflux permease